MSELELRTQFEAIRPALDCWGRFVSSTIIDQITVKLKEAGDRRAVADFLKIPPKYRVKDVGSFVSKALHRGKGYKNPLEQVTDLVGVRFVVLLSSETSLIDKIIEDAAQWEFSKDRDFERERGIRPHFFDYESNHYIVRNVRTRSIDGVSIPSNTACEIQVRTLLQHAYAELSHDRLYKPECKVPDEVRRLVARGSALLETTDGVFCQVSESIGNALKALRDVHTRAIFVCESNHIPLSGAEAQITFNLLENYRTVVPDITIESLSDLLTRRDYIPSRMKERSNESLLFSHPVGLISYWLLDRLGSSAVEHWPFDLSLLEQIAGDLGVSLGDH